MDYLKIPNNRRRYSGDDISKLRQQPSSNGTFSYDTPFETTNPVQDQIAMDNLDKVIKKRQRRRLNKWTLIVTFISLILIIIFVTVAFLVAKGILLKNEAININCARDTNCKMVLAETIPPVLSFTPTNNSIAMHWLELISKAKSKINILSFYWTMKSSDVAGGLYRQAKIGEDILKALKNSANSGIKIQIVQGVPSTQFPNLNTKELNQLKNIEVRSIDMTKLVDAGIIHTKVISVDDKHMYVGSANFDWRALTEVKELGLILYNCPCAGADLQKIFETNWILAKKNAKLPIEWPLSLLTDYNQEKPMTVDINGISTHLYWSTSPPEFCPPERSDDISAILNLINKANSFVYIAVMDYQAAIIYSNPKKFWPVIDDALRRAVYDRGVVVNFLSSYWSHTSDDQIAFLKSLNEFGKMKRNNGSLHVRMFSMNASSIPFTRVNHNKYMVTDNAALVSTSNWSGDYFISTGGVSLVLNQTSSLKGSVQEELRSVFLRDWNSEYALEIDKFSIKGNVG